MTRSIWMNNRSISLVFRLIQHLRQRGAGIQGTGGGVDEHPLTAGGGHRVTLQRNVRVAGGDPGVAEKMTHAQNVAELVRR